MSNETVIQIDPSQFSTLANGISNTTSSVTSGDASLQNSIGSLWNAVNSTTQAVYGQENTVVSYLNNFQTGIVELLGVAMVAAGLIAFAVAFFVTRR